MTSPSPYQFKEPSLVGRFSELSQLEAAFMEAQAGTRTLVYLESASGMGKSRLLHDFSAAAERRGARLFSATGMVLSGHRPFHAFRTILEQLAERPAENRAFLEQVQAALKGSEDALVAAAPEFRALFPHASGRDAGPEGAGEDRIIRALSRLLGALGSGEQTAVVLFDDCQWMDEATLRVVTLGQEQSRTRSKLLVVASFRPEDLPARCPLRSITPRAIHLKPLSQTEVSSLISDVAGEIAPDALSVVHQLTGGTPFMVLTVFRGLVESDVLRRAGGRWQLAPSETTHDISALQQPPTAFLRRRFEILDPPLLKLLQCGAILGKDFETALARRLCGTSADIAGKYFEEAQLRFILTAAADGKTGFVHDKLRETVLEMLADSERRDLHARAARAIAAQAPDRVFDISFHLARAEEYFEALPYALKAAQQARTSHSLPVAEEEYRTALRGAAGEPREVRQQISEGLGRVLLARGHYDESEAQLLAALELSDDAMTKARIYEHLGELKNHTSDHKTGLRYVETGLALLDADVSSNLVRIIFNTVRELIVQTAHSIAPRAFLGRRKFYDRERQRLIHRLQLFYQYFAFFDCKIAEVLSVHLECLNRLETLPPTRELAHIYALHEIFCTEVPWFSRSFAYANRALKIADDLDDVWMQGFVHAMKGVGYYIATRFREGLDELYRGEELLDRSGDRWESNIAGCNIAYCLYRLGNLSAAIETAQRVAKEAFAIGNYIPGASALSCWAKASGGAVPEDVITSALAKAPSLDIQSSVEIKQAAGVWQLARGDTESAVNTLRSALAQFRAKHLKQEYVISTIPWLVTALRRLIESLPAADGARRKLLEREAWKVCRMGLRLMRRFRLNLPHIYREAGLLSALRPRGAAKAKEFLLKSLREAERQEALSAAAETRLAIGIVGKRCGWPGAEETWKQASAELERLGANVAFYLA